MNNYCTNCGKKLKENTIMCEKCRTPVVDIEKNYLDYKKSSIPFTFISIILVFTLYSLYLVFVSFS